MKHYIKLMVLAFIVFLISMFRFRFRPFILQSGSMEPAFKTGSLVIADTQVNPYDASIGDVVVYKTDEGAYVMHRIIAPGLLRGDAGSVAQHVNLTDENYIGKPVLSLYLPGIERAARAASSRRFLLFIISLLFLAGSAITSIFHSERDRL